jgi:hypothetical protein
MQSVSPRNYSTSLKQYSWQLLDLQKKRNGLVFGSNSSLENNFKPSASGLKQTKGPALFGPTRS